jgi:hypothetical protein
MVEIEHPAKRLFTKDRTPTAEFTQAKTQLAQWRVWFDSPTNRQLFIEEYGIPRDIRNFRQMGLHLILVFGRRAEFERDEELSKLRSYLLNGTDEDLVSFDRLTVDKDLTDALTVKPEGYGKYKVLEVPETFALSPWNAEDVADLTGFDEAVNASPTLSQERKDFLKRRRIYWQQWAKSPSRGSYGSGIFRE